MAVDVELEERLRDALAAEAGVTERRMFGGLAFVLDGNMAVCASGAGGLMVRVDRDETERLLATTAATPMEMRGRTMTGWVRVAADAVAEEAELERWVAVGVAEARSHPPK